MHHEMIITINLVNANIDTKSKIKKSPFDENSRFTLLPDFLHNI